MSGGMCCFETLAIQGMFCLVALRSPARLSKQWTWSGRCKTSFFFLPRLDFKFDPFLFFRG